MKWSELSMTEKNEVIKMAVAQGIRDIPSIKNLYEESVNGSRRFDDGGTIHIDPSKKGTFTAAASKHGMGVQEFASKVLSHPENYSLTMRKKANFARNASHWKH